MTENRKYRTQQYAVRADVDAEGLLKVCVSDLVMSALDSARVNGRKCTTS